MVALQEVMQPTVALTRSELEVPYHLNLTPPQNQRLSKLTLPQVKLRLLVNPYEQRLVRSQAH